MIIDEVANEVLKLIDENLVLTELCVGVRYTYAIVKGKHGIAMGVAHTLLSDLPHGVWLEKKPNISDILDFVSSCNILYKIIGIAMLNAVSQYLIKFGDYKSGLIFNTDILDVLDIRSEDHVVFVGNIRPLVSKVKERTSSIDVLERSPFSRDDAKPDVLAPRIIPKATVLLITGSTLENDTLDYVLSLASRARVKALVGPTAQILPQSLKGYVDLVASIMIRDVEKAIEAIRLCGGTKALLRYSEKYVAKVT